MATQRRIGRTQIAVATVVGTFARAFRDLHEGRSASPKIVLHP